MLRRSPCCCAAVLRRSGAFNCHNGPVRPELSIAGTTVPEASKVEIAIPVARLPSGSWMTMPLTVVAGVDPGPVIFCCAAIHGDEVNGVEIIRQVVNRLDPEQMTGTVLAAPVVNVPGFAGRDRYLPDGRDLNRCFPGRVDGSLASRFAAAFMTEVVERCDLGLDFHTGARGRSNLPQIRVAVDDAPSLRLAEIFRPPIIVHSKIRPGSLRGEATRRGVPHLLFEGGQAGLFDRSTVEAGVKGTMNVLGHLGMIPSSPPSGMDEDVTVCRQSWWVRSPRAGLVRTVVDLGEWVHAKQPLAFVADVFGGDDSAIEAGRSGVVAGRIEHAVVHAGDALFHLGAIEPLPAEDDEDPEEPRD